MLVLGGVLSLAMSTSYASTGYANGHSPHPSAAPDAFFAETSGPTASLPPTVATGVVALGVAPGVANGFHWGTQHGAGVDRVALPRAEEEMLLVDALEQTQRGQLDVALESVADLVRRNPDFRLAQLVYADLLVANTRPLERFGQGVVGDDAQLLESLLEEARMRLRHHRAPPGANMLPEELLRLSDTQRRAVVVDVANARLYVYVNEASGPRLEADFYVSIGKRGAGKEREGDKKTPLGVYFVTGSIEAKALPAFYGNGALPVNYPNEWDRRLGRTGYGIWIHGAPSDTYSRPPRASDGCLVLANNDLSGLLGSLRGKNTPVIITNGVNWLERERVRERAGAFQQRLESWRDDWVRRDIDRYLEHYAGDFVSGTEDFATWAERKRRAMSRDHEIEVELSDVSVFAYPQEAGMRVVSFTQDYVRGEYHSRLRKRQYWRLEGDEQWRIVYEGSARLLDEHLRGIPDSARTGIFGFSP